MMIVTTATNIMTIMKSMMMWVIKMTKIMIGKLLVHY